MGTLQGGLRGGGALGSERSVVVGLGGLGFLGEGMGA